MRRIMDRMSRGIDDEDSNSSSECESDSDEDSMGDSSAAAAATATASTPGELVRAHRKVYDGHCNQRTVKDVAFLGPDSSVVASGSDCGHVFLWHRQSVRTLSLPHVDAL